MYFLVSIGEYVVENLPAIAAAGYAAVMAFKANKRAKAATGDSKLQVKCRNVTTKDFASMIEYHKKEAEFLQGLYDSLYEEEVNKNGNS